MPVQYYSQNGEDSLLWSIFSEATKGIFLDVGALDGMRFSNTYSFEKQGWVGVCVEAHPAYIKFVQKNRPKSKVVHAAVGATDADSVSFYTNKLGSMSTLDKSLENYFKKFGKYFHGFKETKVPMRTVNTILTEAKIDRVNVVSIDIEGTEVDALRGFDLERYSPDVLVIEALTKAKESNLVKYMQSRNYMFPRKVSNNLFFCRTQRDAKILATAPIVPKSRLIHTDHPLKD